MNIFKKFKFIVFFYSNVSFTHISLSFSRDSENFLLIGYPIEAGKYFSLPMAKFKSEFSKLSNRRVEPSLM